MHESKGLHIGKAPSLHLFHTAVRWSMGVEDFDIKVSPFITATPKTIGGNIQPGTVPRYCGGSTEGFTCDQLQCSLNTDVNTDFNTDVIADVTADFFALFRFRVLY